MVLALAAFLLSPSTTAYAQSSRDWSGGGGNGLWNQNNNWAGGTAPNLGDRVFFINNTIPVTTNNTGLNLNWVNFEAGASSDRTVNNGVSLTDWSGNRGKVENKAAASHTINGGVVLNGGNTIYEINPVNASGTLTINGGVSGFNNASKQLYFYGSGTAVINGGITGGGSGPVVLKSDSGSATVIIGGASDYTGQTTIERGTLILSNSAALGSSSQVNLGQNTANAATLRIGENISNGRNINVEFGSGTRTLSYAAGTGTGTQTGSISLNNSSLAFNVATGGTLLFGGGVSAPSGGGDEGRLALDGGGTLIVTNNGSGIASTDRYQVRVGNGTLVIGGGTLIARTNVAGVGHAIDLGVDLNNSIVDAVSSLRASNGVTISNSVFASTTNSRARVIGASGENSSATFSGPFGLRDTALTLDSSNGQTVTVTGAITNFSISGTNYTGSVIKTNAGLAVLSGSNTYSGATTITNGTLRIASSSALGATAAGTTVGSGATLELSNNINVSGEAITLNGTGVSGNGALRNVSGDNTNTGTVTLATSSRINSDAGTLLLTGQVAGDAANSLTVGGVGNTTVAGATSAPRALTKDGSGILQFTTATNTYGLVTINGGTLRNNLDFYTSGLEGSSAGTLNMAAAGIPSQFYADFAGATRTYSGALTGPGNFVKRGAGTQVFDGTYTSTGGLYVDAGVTTLGTNVSGANYAATTTHIGSTQESRHGDSAELRIAGTAGGRTYTNALTVNSNTGSALRLLSFENTAGTNTWSGSMTVNATNNGGLVLSNVAGGTALASGSISGPGALSKNGAGALVLAGSNSHSGGTYLNEGTLRVSHVNAAGTGSIVQSNGTSTLEFGAGGAVTNAMSVYNVAFVNNGNDLSGRITNNNATYDVAAGTTNTISGYMTGSGGLVKTGEGVLSVTGATNDYAGATTISNGTLRVTTLANAGAVSSIGTNAAVNFSGTNAATTVLDYTGGNVATDRSLTFNGVATNNEGGTLRISNSSTVVTLTGSASGTGRMVVDGGTVVLSNTSTSNNFAPASIEVNSGATLQLGASNQIGNATALILDGGTLLTGTSLAGYADTLGTLTLSSSSTINLGSLAGGAGTRDLTFANSSAITWSGSLTITNWQGVADSSGTAGRIFFGVGGLTSGQLAQVQFSGFGSGAKLLSSGELVPIPEPRVYAAAVALLAVAGWRERRRILSLLGRNPSPRA